MTEHTYKRVCRVIGSLAGIDPDRIAPAQALGPMPTPNFYWQNAVKGASLPQPIALDSLDRVNLAMQLEEEFGITLTDDEVDDAALDHVGGLVAFVQGKLDAKPKTYGDLDRGKLLEYCRTHPLGTNFGKSVAESISESIDHASTTGMALLAEMADQNARSHAKRIFRAGWEARHTYAGEPPQSESEELLGIEWAGFAKREGLRP